MHYKAICCPLACLKKKLVTNWKYVPLRIMDLGVPQTQLTSDRPGNLLKLWRDLVKFASRQIKTAPEW